jgi:hypothetical protein
MTKITEEKKQNRREQYLKHYKKERDNGKKYYQKNKEKILKRQKENHKKYPHKRKNYSLKYGYGITLDDYNKMFEQQKGKCAICKRHQNDLTRTLCVDHNHKTNQVRALLCVTCNTDVSVVENRLKEMLTYLNKYRKDVN